MTTADHTIGQIGDLDLSILITAFGHLKMRG